MNLTAAWRAAVPLTIRDSIARARKRLAPFSGTPYYSASGEDAIIVSWFRNFGFDPSRVRYVDIGACHPVHMSNTYMLYRLGACGVLVEPDPDRARVLKQARPRDVVLNAGVAFDDRRGGTLFRFSNPVFNTFSPEKAERVVSDSASWHPGERQQIVGTASVPLIPVNDIISTHLAGSPPHLVSIDTEGCELEILKTLDTDLLSRDPDVPCIVCIEDCGGPETNALLAPCGFDVAARTPANWIFVRHRERWVFMREREKSRSSEG